MDKLQIMLTEFNELVSKAKALNEKGDQISETESDDLETLMAAIDEKKAEIEGYRAKAAVKDRLNKAESWLDQVPPPVSAEPELEIAGTFDKPMQLMDYQSQAYVDRFGGLACMPNNKWAAKAAFHGGHWFLAAVHGNEASKKYCADHEIQIKAVMEGATNTAGGYLVPTEFKSLIDILRESRGVFRQWADVEPMASDHDFFPRQVGGITAYAVGENLASAITASDQTYGGVEITAKTWAARTLVAMNLADDAIVRIGERLARDFAYAFADKEDEAGFNGDGTSTYHGVHGIVPKIDTAPHTASISTAITGNTAYSTLDLLDIHNLEGKVPDYVNPDEIAFFVSKPGWAASLSRLAWAAGGSTRSEMETVRSRKEYDGYPIVWVNVMNKVLTAQTSTVIMLHGSLKACAKLGSRKETMIMTLNERYADQLQIGFVAHTRFGINIYELGDTTNAGPLVALKTPSS